MFDVVVEIIFYLYGRFIGRPWQQRRARRLIGEGKVRSALFDGDDGVLPWSHHDGVAEVWEGRLRLTGADLWIRSVDAEVEAGPIDPFATGRMKRPDDRLTFGPKTSIFTLRTHTGGHVRWAVLDFQAEQALGLLGVPTPGTPPAPGGSGCADLRS